MNTLFEQSKESRTDQWLTPPSIIKALGEFDLDPCSPINRPWPTAKTHFTELNNGLIQNWFGRVWCNPPYSDIGSWLKKCVYHDNAIALVFARTETEAFFRYVWPKACSIFFFASRIQFYSLQGVKARNAGAPSVLVAYGENNSDAIESSGLRGKHVPINNVNILVVGVSPSWYSVIRIACRQFGDNDLKPIYDMVERMAPDKVSKNQHWKEKIRQQVQVYRKKESKEKMQNYNTA